jgi:hypothetical protein
MTTASRLAGFAAALAITFGGAVAVGSTIGPQRGQDGGTDDASGMSGMIGSEAGATTVQPVRGLAVTDGGLTLRLDRSSAQRGRRFELAFRIVGNDGRAVRDFDVEHTKRMHLIVVRRDFTGFQHLHPTEATDGTWTVPLILEDAGSYRVFADFSVAGRPRTLADDLAVDGTVRSSPLPAPVATQSVDGLDVRLTEGASRAGRESELAFTVTRNGAAVPIDDYLGAKGHLVALRQGDLAFLHVHPDEASLRFMATFPSAGRYRLFLQFRTGARVHTVAFTQVVSR